MINFKQSRLIENIDDTVTEVLVQSSIFDDPPFYLVIGNEIVNCVNVSDNLLTIQRGQQDTIAESHNIGDLITRSITKEDLMNGGGGGGGSGLIIYDSFNNRPDPSVLGAYFLANDSPIESYYDGIEWHSRLYGTVIKEYDDSQFSWVNQGGASINVSRGYGVMTVPASASREIRSRVKTAPSTPYTITAYLNYTNYNESSQFCGLCFRTSSTGRMTIFGPRDNGTYFVGKFIDNQTFDSLYTVPANIAGVNITAGMWLRIQDNGTSRGYLLSVDGIHWVFLLSHSRTDFHTPNQVGWCGNSQNSREIKVNLYSWLEGTDI